MKKTFSAFAFFRGRDKLWGLVINIDTKPECPYDNPLLYTIRNVSPYREHVGLVSVSSSSKWKSGTLEHWRRSWDSHTLEGR
jgi:hypothetical protein